MSPPLDVQRACQQGDPRFELWLRFSSGFRVGTSHHRLGVVKRPVEGTSTTLVVGTGLLRRKTIEVRAEEIDWILPAGRLLLLRPSSAAARLDGMESTVSSSSPQGARLRGYAVCTVAGHRVGTVAAIVGRSVMIEAGMWPFRHYRGVALTDTLVRHAEQTVIALAPASRLRKGQTLRHIDDRPTGVEERSTTPRSPPGNAKHHRASFRIQ